MNLDRYPITYMSAGLSTSSMSLIFKSSDGSFPPTFQVLTDTLRIERNTKESKKKSTKYQMLNSSKIVKKTVVKCKSHVKAYLSSFASIYCARIVSDFRRLDLGKAPVDQLKKNYLVNE